MSPGQVKKDHHWSVPTAARARTTKPADKRHVSAFGQLRWASAPGASEAASGTRVRSAEARERPDRPDSRAGPCVVRDKNVTRGRHLQVPALGRGPRSQTCAPTGWLTAATGGLARCECQNPRPTSRSRTPAATKAAMAAYPAIVPIVANANP